MALWRFVEYKQGYPNINTVYIEKIMPNLLSMRVVFGIVLNLRVGTGFYFYVSLKSITPSTWARGFFVIAAFDL